MIYTLVSSMTLSVISNDSAFLCKQYWRRLYVIDQKTCTLKFKKLTVQVVIQVLLRRFVIICMTSIRRVTKTDNFDFEVDALHHFGLSRKLKAKVYFFLKRKYVSLFLFLLYQKMLHANLKGNHAWYTNARAISVSGKNAVGYQLFRQCVIFTYMYNYLISDRLNWWRNWWTKLKGAVNSIYPYGGLCTVYICWPVRQKWSLLM